MKKIIVVGSGGAGKSTFATQLGAILDIEVVHLDKLYWKPNWVKTAEDEWIQIIQNLLKGDSWIIDGNFGGTRAMRIQACDTVIWLDIPRRLCMYRILKRTVTYRGQRRPDMAEGCNERLDWDFIKWVWNYPHRAKSRIMVEIEGLRDKDAIILKSSRDVREFLSNLRSNRTIGVPPTIANGF